MQAARKVYETALASLAARPASVGRSAALLALPFADMEAAGRGKDAVARALHVLLWLGIGGDYAPFHARATTGIGSDQYAPASLALSCDILYVSCCAVPYHTIPHHTEPYHMSPYHMIPYYRALCCTEFVLNPIRLCYPPQCT